MREPARIRNPGEPLFKYVPDRFGRPAVVRNHCPELKAATFELSGRRRQDARPGLAKMYRVPPDRAWWPAVGAPLEREASLCLCLKGRSYFSLEYSQANWRLTGEEVKDGAQRDDDSF